MYNISNMKKYGGVDNKILFDEIIEADVLSEPEVYVRPPDPVQTEPVGKPYSFKKDLSGGLVFLWIASPLLIALVFSTTWKDFADKNPLIVAIACATPIFTGVWYLVHIVRKSRK